MVLITLSACGSDQPTTDAAGRMVGRVRNAHANGGVAGADVIVIDSAGAAVAAAIADSAGTFVLPLPVGQYRVRARQIGFNEAESPVVTIRADTPETQVEVALELVALPMSSLMVSTSGAESARAGFTTRRQLGTGVFLTEDSIAARRPSRVVDAFRGIPAVVVEESRNVSKSFVVRTLSDAACLAVFVDTNPLPYSFTGSEERRAPPLAASGDADINSLYRVSELRAIELYHDWAAVPAELKQAGRITNVAPCGVAIIWTRAAW